MFFHFFKFMDVLLISNIPRSGVAGVRYVSIRYEILDDTLEDFYAI